MMKLLMLTLCFGLVYAELQFEEKDPSELVESLLDNEKDIVELLDHNDKVLRLVSPNFDLSPILNKENLKELNRKKGDVICPNVKTWVVQREEYSTVYITFEKPGHEPTEKEDEKFKKWLEKFEPPNSTVIQLDEDENCALMYLLLEEFFPKRVE